LHNTFFFAIVIVVETAVNGNPAPSPIPLGVSHHLRRAHNALRFQIAQHLERYGISMKHFHFLKALQYEDGITQIELSRRVGCERATVTVVMDELEKLGYVRRTRNKVDRRKLHVFLTPKGRRTRAARADAVVSTQDVALGGISDAEYEMFKALLDKIVVNCDTHRANELERAAS
jgi:DNA-binding MarR family transcriptional regulator